MAKVREQQELVTELNSFGFRMAGTLAQQYPNIFEEGSPAKMALHGVVGLLSGSISGGAIQGMTTAAANEWLTAQVKEYLKDKPLTDNQKALIHSMVSGVAGYVLSGEAGANIAMQAVQNNYLTHAQANKLRDDLKACKEEQSCKDKLLVQAQAQSTANDKALIDACKVVESNACINHLQALFEGQSTLQGLGMQYQFNGLEKYSDKIQRTANDVKLVLYPQQAYLAYVKESCGGSNSVGCSAKFKEEQEKGAVTRLLGNVKEWNREALEDLGQPPSEVKIQALAMTYALNETFFPEDGLELLLSVTGSKLFMDMVKKAGGSEKAVARLESIEVKNIDNNPLVATNKATCSFRGDMQVKTLTGYTAISNIQLSDLVFSKDELTGITSYQKVLAHYSNPYQETVYVTVKDKTGRLQTIVSNKIHPYFTVTNQVIASSEGHRYSGGITGGQWVDASKLQQGFKLLDDAGLWQEVVSVQIKPEPLQAYNLTIDQTHTYFIKGVDGVEGVWVHNNCWDKLPSDAVPTGKTTPDATGRPLYTFKDKDGKQVTAYQGSDGRWYDPKVYPPTKPTATGAKAQDEDINSQREVGTQRNSYTLQQATNVAISHGYEVKKIDGVTIFVNTKATPPYLVKSTTGHRNEMFKGFDNMKNAIKGAITNSSKTSERLGTYDENLNKIGK